MSRWEGTEGRPTGLGDSGTALRGPREEPLLTRQVTGPHRARGPATRGTAGDGFLCEPRARREVTPETGTEREASAPRRLPLLA